jgi:crotonobetainyl-CoA:carnitine CoA-transferase CaiB-like acyl-CoA transferase
MAGYDFLKGLRVVEVSWFGPDALGGCLADLGAEVLKIEGAEPDPLRTAGTPAVGTPDGPSLLHLRWNRGKQSVGLNLKHPDGQRLFRELADRSHVIIEGTRAGMLERLGLGHDSLRRTNPRLVFCSLSGFGTSGPYHSLGSHAPAFDAFAGIAAINPYALSPAERRQTPYVPIGMNAMGLYAVIGVLAAVHRAERTGQGVFVEVSGAEAAAHFMPEAINCILNSGRLVEREPPFEGADGRMLGWPKLYAYATSDGRGIFLQAQSPKFWSRFCAAVERPDLDASAPPDADPLALDAKLHAALTTLFRSRSFADWMRLFTEHDVPGAPVNDVAQLASDPHFLARGNVYDTRCHGQKLRLTSTPIKTSGQAFEPAPPPNAWADTEAVLRRVLGLAPEEINRLTAERAIHAPPTGSG